MKTQSFLASILAVLVSSMVAAAKEIIEASMLAGGRSEHFFSTAEEESSRGLTGTEVEWEDVKYGAQIKRRFNTFQCLTTDSAGGTVIFDKCEVRQKAPYQYWELKRSYLISTYLYWKDKEEWCLTYVPNKNSLTLAKCRRGNNLQRWGYDGFNHFQSFFDTGLCLEHSNGKAQLGECDTFDDDQAFLFRYY